MIETILRYIGVIFYPIQILYFIIFRLFFYKKIKYVFLTDILLCLVFGYTYISYYYIYGSYDKFIFSLIYDHTILYAEMALIPAGYFAITCPIKFKQNTRKQLYCALGVRLLMLFNFLFADEVCTRRLKTTYVDIYNITRVFFVDRSQNIVTIPPKRDGIYYFATIVDIKKDDEGMSITLKSDYNGENCISLKTTKYSDSFMQMLTEGNQLLMHDESNTPCLYPDLSVKITECINKYKAPVRYYKEFIYPASGDYILNKEGVNIVYRADTEYFEGDSSIVTASFTDICDINRWELFDSSQIKGRNKILLFRNVKRDSTYTILNVTEQFANSCNESYYYYEMGRIYDPATLERWYPELYEYKSLLMLESPLYNNKLYLVYKSKVVNRDSNEVKLQFKDIFKDDKTISYSCNGFEVPDTLLVYKIPGISRYFICCDEVNTSENWSKISDYGYTMGCKIYRAKEVEEFFPDAKDVCKQNLLPK